MATNQTVTSGFSAEKFDRVDDLLQKLKEEARACHDAGDTFMLGVYSALLAVTSPIVVRAKARLEREERATINKAHKGLRKQEREARQAQATPEQ